MFCCSSRDSVNECIVDENTDENIRIRKLEKSVSEYL